MNRRNHRGEAWLAVTLALTLIWCVSRCTMLRIGLQ